MDRRVLHNLLKTCGPRRLHGLVGALGHQIVREFKCSPQDFDLLLKGVRSHQNVVHNFTQVVSHVLMHLAIPSFDLLAEDKNNAAKKRRQIFLEDFSSPAKNLHLLLLLERLHHLRHVLSGI